MTILDISDYHAQLTPLAEAADTVAAPAAPPFGIGGSAFLKAWFETTRRSRLSSSTTTRSIRTSVEIAAGDSFGRCDPTDLELLR